MPTRRGHPFRHCIKHQGEDLHVAAFTSQKTDDVGANGRFYSCLASSYGKQVLVLSRLPEISPISALISGTMIFEKRKCSRSAWGRATNFAKSLVSGAFPRL